MADENSTNTPSPSTGGSDVDENKVIAAIGYIGILFLVPLLAKRDSAFAQYHARQGLVLFIFEILAGVVFAIPVIGWLVGPIAYIVGFILFIMGLINALGGKTAPLPIIGKFGESIKI